MLFLINLPPYSIEFVEKLLRWT